MSWSCRWLRHIPILALLILFCGWTGKAAAAPNVLIVISDDQRTAGTMDTSSMARTRGWFETGNVPGRGAVTGGTGFPNAVVTTSLCCPSRSTIFTGLYAHNHEVKRTPDATELDDEIAAGRTLQSYLNRPVAGLDYQTALFGKYLNNMGLMNPPDFDRYITFEGNQYLASRVNDQGMHKTVLEYSTDYFVNRAIEFIDEAENDPGNRPWFLVVAPAAPHDPLQPAARHADAAVEPFTEPPSYLEQDLTDKPAWVRATDTDDTDHRAHQREQLRMLLALDEGVDRIMDKISAEGQDANTLAFYVGDNGWHLGEHGLDGKGSPYREAVQTPLYMRWPGSPAVAPGSSARLAENVDVAPTVLEAVGGPGPWPAMDGRSLLGPAGSRNRQLTEGWGSTTSGRTFQSIRTATFTYIETDGIDNDNPPVEDVSEREYYDLTRDPYETENLLRDDDAENDPPVDKLHDQLALDGSCDEAQCPPTAGDAAVFPADTKISAAPDTPTSNTSARFVFTSSVPTDDFECALDGAAFTACPASSRPWPYTVTYNGLASGPHNLSVRADSDGNGASPADQTPATHAWTVSAGAPDTSITSKPAKLTNNTAATLSFTGSAGTTGFECKLEVDPPQAAAQFAACGSPRTYTNLTGVRHRFSVRATGPGAAVDQTPDTYQWTIDTTSPTPKSNQPGGEGANPPTLTSSTVYFTPGFTAPEDDDAELTCMLDGRPETLKPCAFRTPFTDISNGSHTLTVTGRDLAGNSASVQKPFQVDSMPTYDSVPDTGWPDVDDGLDGSEVRAVIPDGAGGWYVGGNFTQVGGQARTDLVHLTAQKQVDSSWAPSTGNGAVNALALSGGKVYIAGTFTSMNGVQRNRLAAVGAAGAPGAGVLDAQWNPGADQAVNDLEAAGGSIFAVGDFTQVGGADRERIVELTPGGAVTGWGQRLNQHSVSASLSLRAIEVTASSVYVGGAGTISEVNGTGGLVASRAHLAEIDRGTEAVRSTLPQPANPGAPTSVESLQLAPGSTPDSLFVGGRFTSPRSTAFQVTLASGAETGWRPVPDLGAGNLGVVYDIDATALHRSDGERRWSVMLGGNFDKVKAQYKPINVAETTVVGPSSAADGFPTDWDAKLNDTVTDDNPAGPGNAGTTKVLDTATSGGVLAVGGDFSKAGYVDRGDLAFFADPAPDTEITGKISPPLTGSHYALFHFRSSEPHSTLECKLDGGAFSPCTSPQVFYGMSDGTHRFEVRARDSRGTADPSPDAHDWTVRDFTDDPNTEWPQIGDGNDVRAIVADGKGGWYVGGDFTTVCESPFGPADCHPHEDLVHINRDKTVDNSWNPSVQRAAGDPQPTVGVRALAFSPKRRTLYVGGTFTQVNGVSSPDLRGLAAIDTQTGGALAWDPAVTGHVYAMRLAQDAATPSLYVGGTLTSVKGQARGRLAEVRLDNAQPTSWNPNITAAGGTPQVLALAVSDDKVYAGGVDFGSVGAQTNTGNLVEIDRASGQASTGWRPRPSSPGNPAGNVVHTLELSRSGNAVYAGGSFTQVESAGTPVTRNRAAAIDVNPTGTVRAWNPNAGADVTALLPVDTTVLLGGSFGTVQGAPRTRLAQTRLDGSPTAWTPSLDAAPLALATQATSGGQVLAAGGTFQNAGATPRRFLAFYGPPDG